MAVVERSVLTEHSHAEQHAKVSASILGPNTAVARGEVTSSLVGPFVSMHHESLLIASLWPEGRGNVSYGAMAGANHTTKAPDQEFLPGEGMFLGLGVKIRFPADFSQAPYSVFASGVETLPQKLLFPFSLINRPSSAQPGVSTAYNEISPAWVLTDNAYALVRTESKHRSRNRARRSRFDFAILRPQIIDWIRSACRRLERVKEIKPVYTDGDIIGLGKNFLLEASRQRAIDGYRFHVRRYALMKLREKMASANARDAQVLAEVSDEPEWEHARLIVRQDLAISRIEDGLSSLSSMQEEFAKAVERSKAKDDERGPRIIDDYADVHVRAAEDPVIRQTWEETRCLQEEIKTLLTRL
jgi:hypothetical protein